MAPVHVRRHHPGDRIDTGLELANLRHDSGRRARPDSVSPIDQLVAADHDRLAQSMRLHVLDQVLELPARHDREERRRAMNPVLRIAYFHHLIACFIL